MSSAMHNHRPGTSEHVDTVVVGGGQAGLAVGYHLAQRDLPFIVLDASDRIGDAWRNRWDSLRLFTSARRNGLPGMPFPGDPDALPTKDEVADYLQTYAARFDLPVHTGTRVDRVSRDGDGFIVAAGMRRFEANNVVVAMSSFQRPWTPAFAQELDHGILQLHAGGYRNPSQLRDGAVLVVGAHDSGAEIALDVARGHRTWLAGRSTGRVPFRIDSLVGRRFGVPVVMFLFSHVLSVHTPIGRRLRPRLLHHAGPVVRVKPKDLATAGIERVSRVVGVHDGRPVIADRGVVDVSNVIWCTGFRPDFSWIDLPVFDDDEDREPQHEEGVVPTIPGLYFVGLFFLSRATSSLLLGVGRDAARVAEAIATRATRTRTAA